MSVTRRLLRTVDTKGTQGFKAGGSVPQAVARSCGLRQGDNRESVRQCGLDRPRPRARRSNHHNLQSLYRRIAMAGL